MKIIQNNFKHLNEASQLLKSGKLIAFPTDTCYGIVGLFKAETLVMINQAKQRDLNKKIPVLYTKYEQVLEFSQKHCDFVDNFKYINRTTLIFDKHKFAYRKIYKEDNYYLYKLIEKVGAVFASSFNLNNQATINQLSDLEKQQALHANIDTWYFFEHYLNEQPSDICQVSKDFKVVTKKR